MQTCTHCIIQRTLAVLNTHLCVQVKHEEFKQGVEQRAAAQAAEVARLQEQQGELQRLNAELRSQAETASGKAGAEAQRLQGQVSELQVRDSWVHLRRASPASASCRVSCSA